MNNNLLFDNELTYYSILIIGSGLILVCTLYYLNKSLNTAIPTQNIEALTHGEIEAIIQENAVTVGKMNSEDMDAIVDSETDTDVEFDYQDTFDNISRSDIEEILNDPDLFFMPNVDFDVCPIEELKFFEFTSLYAREIAEHSISDEEIMEFISWFSKEDLATNWINETFLAVITIV
uniref:Uncharacterized protein n=1 Tax=Russula subnigricans TaxID=258989 RepID=A0A649WI07_9AGAM|nr:hypothetical protein [Russula subnigricans]QGK88086.1 hypothetical protein [Russula subnigricans]